MPRPLWKGAISFGMVSIPIRLYTATEDKDVHFNMLHREDLARVRQKLFCEEEEIEVNRSTDVVKGYEVTPGNYVTIEDEDLEKVPVNTTRTIEITDFVSLEEIDPILYQKTYFLEPDEIGHKPFALLMRALEETGRVAIAKVALRQKEQLCTLRIYGGTIALETMYYADEVRGTSQLSLPAEDIEISDRELKMATSIVDMLTGEFNYEQYKDNYREALLEIISMKADGQTIEAPEPKAAKITDLTEALRASVEEIRRRKDGEGESSGSRRRAKSA